MAGIENDSFYGGDMNLDPQQPRPARRNGDPIPSSPNGSESGVIARVTVPIGSAPTAPITTTETPLANTVTVSGSDSPAVGPSSGPAPQQGFSESGRTGLFGVNLGGFAAVGYGGVAAADASYVLGMNASGNGGLGGAGSIGTVITDEVTSQGFGYPSDEGWGYGIAAAAGPGLFLSNADSYQQLQGPFHTTVVATPIITFQYDSAVGDPNLRAVQFSGPSGLGIFHFTTTTPASTTWDLSVREPLN